MAKDVHSALIEIAQTEGKLKKEDAENYINQTLMKDERRYLRDVY
jgi:sulfite reductase (NADPH) flavoprotein alpha-component